MANPRIETADGCELREALRLLDRVAGEVFDMVATRREAGEAAEGLRCVYCTGCGRMSEDCSADPCADVIAEREESDADNAEEAAAVDVGAVPRLLADAEAFERAGDTEQAKECRERAALLCGVCGVAVPAEAEGICDSCLPGAIA